jgi:hypothetical protein
MSFVHFHLVADVDPSDPIDPEFMIPKVLRPIDRETVDRVLSAMPTKMDHIVSVESYGAVRCRLYVGVANEVVDQFARQLADEIGGVVIGDDGIWYPVAAKDLYDVHRSAIMERVREHRLRARSQIVQSALPFSIGVRNREPVSCPSCGKFLRTPLAKQCQHCKMDWHNPDNVYRKKKSPSSG